MTNVIDIKTKKPLTNSQVLGRIRNRRTKEAWEALIKAHDTRTNFILSRGLGLAYAKFERESK